MRLATVRVRLVPTARRRPRLAVAERTVVLRRLLLVPHTALLSAVEAAIGPVRTARRPAVARAPANRASRPLAVPPRELLRQPVDSRLPAMQIEFGLLGLVAVRHGPVLAARSNSRPLAYRRLKLLLSPTPVLVGPIDIKGQVAKVRMRPTFLLVLGAQTFFADLSPTPPSAPASLVLSSRRHVDPGHNVLTIFYSRPLAAVVARPGPLAVPLGPVSSAPHASSFAPPVPEGQDQILGREPSYLLVLN